MAVHCPCLQKQSAMRTKAMDMGAFAEKGPLILPADY